MIRALPNPADVTIKDKAAIEEAKAALDALTSDQKKFVTLADKMNLKMIEAALAKIENDIASADAVKEQINALPAAEDVVLESAFDIRGTRALYNALTEDQKALIDEDTYKKLTDAEEALAGLVDVEIVKTGINSLPAAEDVTINDKSKIEEVREAYDALNAAQKEQVGEDTYKKLTDAEEAVASIEADIEAAQAVKEQIDALPAATKVTVNDKKDIEAAKAAYDALTDAQKNYVPLAEKTKLLLDVAALDAAEKFAADEAAADAVEDMIRALPAADDVTLEDKAAIEEAKAAYDALTKDQKKLVNLTDRAKLALDEAAIEKIENDIAEAEAVKEQINALPAAADVALDNAPDIMAARAAYEALTDEQKALIDEDTYKKLTEDEDAVSDIISTEPVKALINALPAAEDVTINDKDYIETAREAYEALTDGQKALVDEDSYKKLTDAEEALAKIEEQIQADAEAAQAVKEQIDALPAANKVTVNDKDAIEAARAAYDALTDAQKELVPFAEKAKLVVDEAALDAAEKFAADEAAADAVEDMIRALPAAADVTLDDKAAIEEAKAAYDALTKDQKKLVNLTDRVKLAMDEAAIDKIENDIASAEAVKEQINALPNAEDVTIGDAFDIMAARAAYEALTDDQKALIDEDTYKKLTDDEAAVANVIAVEPVKTLINALPDADDVTVMDKPFIEAVRDAYDSLTDEQKALIDEDTYKKLTDAEEALAAAEKAAEDEAAAAAVRDMINALPDADDVTADDKDDIEAARAAYDALTDDRKALIDEDTYKKLTDAEDSLKPSILLGDANGDGIVSIKDVTTIQNHVALVKVLDETHQIASDVNRDGIVDVKDATILQMYIAGYKVDYPIGEYV